MGPGLTIWPTFTAPGLPPGNVLITFDDYSVAPGAIFYDVVGASDAVEFATVAAIAGIGLAAGLSAELEAVREVELVAAVAAPAVADVEEGELDADIVGRIGIDSLLAAA